MKNSFFNEDDLKEVLDKLNDIDDTKILEIEETEEMKAANKRFEDYLLKHKNDNN